MNLLSHNNFLHHHVHLRLTVTRGCDVDSTNRVNDIKTFDDFSEDGADEGAYFPAQCIKVNGADSIRSLRDFCTELLNERDANAS